VPETLQLGGTILILRIARFCEQQDTFSADHPDPQDFCWSMSNVLRMMGAPRLPDFPMTTVLPGERKGVTKTEDQITIFVNTDQSDCAAT
jgi:hypothetical protein